MSRAVFVRSHGGPEVLSIEERELGAPGSGQIRVRNRAIGLNFIDTYQRSGLYSVPLPFVAGNEGAGEVTHVGEGVTDFRVGDRVAYSSPVGAYADERMLPADRAVPVPDSVSDEVAAAALLKGTTAFYLLHWTHAVTAGDTLLIHAAAGGTGQFLTQWAHAKGATVIATAGSDDKCAVARHNGADIAINYRTGDFVAEVRAFTGGKGVDVVYDLVGKDTFPKSLDCLKPFGLFCSFGNASGPVPPFSLQELASRGSLFATRQTLFTHIGPRAALEEIAGDLFAVIASGAVEIPLSKRWKLTEAADAHRALEARATTGSMVLIP